MQMAMLQAGLVPGSYVGMGNDGTGCFTRGTGVSMGKQCYIVRQTEKEAVGISAKASFTLLFQLSAGAFCTNKSLLCPLYRCVACSSDICRRI